MAGEDLQSKAAELMRKVLTVGVGTLFLTEEALRGLVSELKLPKELLGSILESAGKTKNDFLQSLSKDVLSRVTDRFDPKALVQEFLSSNEINFHVKVTFQPKDPPKDSPKAPARANPEPAGEGDGP
jgi:hypothetical protein